MLPLDDDRVDLVALLDGIHDRLVLRPMTSPKIVCLPFSAGWARG